jgi:hypothetical protein
LRHTEKFAYLAASNMHPMQRPTWADSGHKTFARSPGDSFGDTTFFPRKSLFLVRLHTATDQTPSPCNGCRWPLPEAMDCADLLDHGGLTRRGDLHLHVRPALCL